MRQLHFYIFCVALVMFVASASFCEGAWSIFRNHSYDNPWCLATQQGWCNHTFNCSGIGWNNVSAVYLYVYTPGMSETAILRYHVTWGFHVVSDPSDVLESENGFFGALAPPLGYTNFTWTFTAAANYPGYCVYKWLVVTYNFGSYTKQYNDTSYLDICAGNTQASGSGNYWGWLSYSAWRGAVEWLHGGVTFDTVDYYDDIVVRYIYDVPAGSLAYLCMSNVTHPHVWQSNVTSGVVWKWRSAFVPRIPSISHGYYLMVLNCSVHGVLAQRDLFIIRPGLEWSVDVDHVYYGRAGIGSMVKSQPIEVRCRNYKYWRSVDALNPYHPVDAEAWGWVHVTSITTGEILSADQIKFYNDSARGQDIVAIWEPAIASIGSYESPHVNIKVWLVKGTMINEVVYEWNATLEPFALGAGGVEEIAYVFGFPSRLTRYMVAVGITGVILMIVYSVVNVNSFATIMFFFAILMFWAVVGWFPIWIPAFVLILLGGMLFIGVGMEPPASSAFEIESLE